MLFRKVSREIFRGFSMRRTVAFLAGMAIFIFMLLGAFKFFQNLREGRSWPEVIPWFSYEEIRNGKLP
jgi:hypothetical protein